jgi:hypothetical protein
MAGLGGRLPESVNVEEGQLTCRPPLAFAPTCYIGSDGRRGLIGGIKYLGRGRALILLLSIATSLFLAAVVLL